jgi:hypothetical protein
MCDVMHVCLFQKTAMPINDNPAESAAQKIATGALMTLNEVAARLAVSPMTVHKMPLKSIRLGRSLRFDPRDVEQLIEASKESIISRDAIAAAMAQPAAVLDAMESLAKKRITQESAIETALQPTAMEKAAAYIRGEDHAG